MQNITPDTHFQWIGGCWSAVPNPKQTPEATASAERNAPAPDAAPAQENKARNAGGSHATGDGN